ncbi:MAG: ABC transporter ATP-binding protein [Muribaculaceae bacterium]|nr:ABC transporter ATP-binding protein [Muribaculaceae bacterium]
MSIISLKEVTKLYRTKEVETIALENVNLDIEKGEFVSIMGPSGCGKSTLLNIIGLLDTPTSGNVALLGRDTSGISDSAAAHFRNENLGFVFQSFHLIPSLNVAANVELPLIYRKGVSASERRRRVEEVLERLGMTHRIKHLPTQLSGGQCQRVAIARAIVGGPQIVLADEPTGNLDSKMGAEVMALLHKLNKEDGTTVVMVTHNEEQALQTDRIIRFFDGHIIS